MKTITTEVKVGIFFLIAVLMLAYMTVTVGKWKWGKAKGYLVYAELESIAGVEPKSPVQIAGVNIGRVEKIRLKNNKALVTMMINNDVKLPRDSKAIVTAKGLMGEKLIKIIPGTEGPPFIEPGGKIIYTEPSVSIEQFAKKLSVIGDDISKITTALNEVIGTKEGQQKIKNIVRNIDNFSQQLNDMITVNKEKINSLIANVDKASNAFLSIVAKIDRGEGTLGKLLTDDALYDQAKDVVYNLQMVSKDLKEGKGTLGKLIKDETAYNELQKTVTSLKEVADRLNKGKGSLGKFLTDEKLYTDLRETLANLKDVSKKINRGEGTLGKLLTDEELYVELKKTMKKMQRSAEAVEEQTPITALGSILGLIF